MGAEETEKKSLAGWSHAVLKLRYGEGFLSLKWELGARRLCLKGKSCWPQP